ncbi:MAG: cytochrome c biogenesis protein CcdA [Armatimonadota bacterium]|nr:cytochrome c biogenesis protein CcdA [Armatimonadota bacterium]
MIEVNVALAFAAGVLGFLSPCIVPLIPGYLSFVSGLSLVEMSLEQRRRHLGRVLLATVLFILGFSTVFTGLGASASVLGGLVLDNRLLLTRIGGAVVIFLGLAVLGVIKVPGFYRTRRFEMSGRPLGLLGAFPVGMAFGFAWTPCVGPVLTAVLTLAAASRTASDGAVLLFAYSLGLGLPFLLAAVLMSAAFDTMGWLRRNARTITTASGVFLLVMGGAMVTDLLFALNTWILRLVPFRPAI